MDGLFERFIRKIGISELSYFEDSHFLSQKYNKETDLLTIEIESSPLILITLIELSPTNVAIAQIVSFILVPFFPQDYSTKALYCK